MAWVTAPKAFTSSSVSRLSIVAPASEAASMDRASTRRGVRSGEACPSVLRATRVSTPSRTSRDSPPVRSVNSATPGEPSRRKASSRSAERSRGMPLKGLRKYARSGSLSPVTNARKILRKAFPRPVSDSSTCPSTRDGMPQDSNASDSTRRHAPTSRTTTPTEPGATPSLRSAAIS